MVERYKDFFLENMKLPFIISLLLIGLSYYNYLLYHTLVEFISIAVGVALFSVIFLFKIKFDNSFLPFIAIGYFYVSMIDLIHTLAYKGMSILPIAGQSANLATQLWIEARFLQALILIIAVSLLNQKISNKKLLAGLGVLFVVTTLFILSGYSPDAYIDAYGLTTFKIVMEYIIVLMLCFALYRFYINRQIIGEKTAFVLSISIILTILSELSFTFYISVFGISNLLGHIFKFFAFWFILIEIRDLIKSKI
jgi:hypothetical protein